MLKRPKGSVAASMDNADGEEQVVGYEDVWGPIPFDDDMERFEAGLPANPLLQLVRTLREERWRLQAGEAHKWVECVISANCHVAATNANLLKPLPEGNNPWEEGEILEVEPEAGCEMDVPGETEDQESVPLYGHTDTPWVEPEELYKSIGRWVVEKFERRDFRALHRLAECWENGGYEHGTPRFKFRDGTSSRKDMLEARNYVQTRLMMNALLEGTTFTNADIRELSKKARILFPEACIGVQGVSDETVKEWREQLGSAGLKYYRKAKVGRPKAPSISATRQRRKN